MSAVFQDKKLELRVLRGLKAGMPLHVRKRDVPLPPAASEAATQAAAAAPKYTQGSALDAYLEATRSAKTGFKAPVPEPPSGSSVQDGLSSAQEAASSAISSLTEGGPAPKLIVQDSYACASHLMCLSTQYLQATGACRLPMLQLDTVLLVCVQVMSMIYICYITPNAETHVCTKRRYH